MHSDGEARAIPAHEDSQMRPSEPSHAGLEDTFSPSDALALAAILAAAVTIISAAAYGGHYVLSEFARYATTDVIRMLGGMP